jgi:NADPH:quinone reductase-like Zn-dependent oxidoreductase
MLAALLQEFGSPVTPGERPDPEPTSDQTLVRVSAAPIVPLDLLCASGTSYFGQPPLPYVPGVQGVGVADGRRVWFATNAGMAPGDGSLAQACAVSPADVVPVSADVADEVVAAIGTSGIAAWMALTWRAQLAPGEKVIVLGATGVVGQVAVALARHLGAGRVVAVARSAAAADRAPLEAADEVVLTADCTDRVALTGRLLEAADGHADVVIDPVFGLPATAAAAALGSGGRLVNIGGAAGDLAEFSSAVLRGRTIAVMGYTNNAISAEQRAEALTGVLGLAASGDVRVSFETRPLTDCSAAWRDAAGSGRRIVVLPPVLA